MQITQILKLLLLTSFLSGCWAVNVKDEAPASIGNIDLLQSFIGQESESVIKELGLPDELLSDGDKQFMVYSARSSGTTFVMVIWLPVWATNESKNTIHCLRIELDSDNFVKEYQVRSRVDRRFVLGFDAVLYSNCREVYWSKKERTKLQKATGFPSTWNTNADAQLILFKNLRGETPEESLVWLCRSADSGNQEARVILAKIYVYGGHVWVKNSVIQQNYKLAYVWYTLSGTYDQEDLRFFADRYLTSKQQLDAKKMFEDWQPGNCERELGLAQNN